MTASDPRPVDGGALPGAARAPAQRGRLLALHTVLGEDRLCAESATIWEGLGPCPDTRFAPPPRRWHEIGAREPVPDWTGSAAEAAAPDRASEPDDGVVGFRIEVVALTADAGLDLASLVGTPVLLRLLTPAGDAARRPWHGLVGECDWLGSDGGLGRVRLLVEPWLAFLRERQDARVFHERDVVEIVDAVFARARGSFGVPVEWRWALADPGGYPRHGRCVQAHESDLAFVERLLRDEGLFCWFEHEAGSTDPRQARHRLVIADHDAAFGRPAGGERVRYTGIDAARRDDGLTRWRDARRVVANDLRWASRDDRGAAMLAASAAAPGPLPLRQHDVPGHDAWPTAADARRRATRRAEALAAFAARGEAVGAWRDAAAGVCFRLVDHPAHDGGDAARDRFLVVAARHRVQHPVRTGTAASGPAGAERGTDADAPRHRCELVVQPAALPFRPLAAPGGVPEARARPRPTAFGVTTAVVVGDGAPVATDRDHRVQIQFHWQRGRDGAHRLPVPDDGDATARSRDGGWVRVAAAIAGDDWGFVHPPRVGQEALVAFAGGDADRPFVLGVLYNGRPHADDAGAANGPGPAGARASAAAWFPGTRRAGEHAGHAHAAVLSGVRTRALADSVEPGGDGNALVFDDSPGDERVELASASARTRLQLGRLRQQHDNRLLQARGHGLDLATDAWGALRAGTGLLVSAYRRAGSTQAGRQLESDELQRRLDRARSDAAALMRAATAHGVDGAPAVPAGGPAACDDTPAAPRDDGRAQPAADARRPAPEPPHRVPHPAHPARSSAATGTDPLARALASLAAAAAGGRGGTAGGTAGTAGRGAGTAAVAFSGPEASARRPPAHDAPPSDDAAPGWLSADLVLTAPAGVATLTPADRAEAVSGDAWRVGARLQRLAGGELGVAAAGEVVLFAAGNADASGPQPDSADAPQPGIRLHAAAGRVALHANTGAARLSASGDACVGSATGNVRAAAPDAIELRAGATAIRIDAGGIVVSSPGRAVFAATLKALLGARRASAGLAALPDGSWELPAPEPARRSVRWQVFGGPDGRPLPDQPYRLVVDGRRVAEGRTDPRGLTDRAIDVAEPQDAELWLGDGDWCIALDDCETRPFPLDAEDATERQGAPDR